MVNIMDQELLDYLKEYKDLMEQTLNRVDAMEDVLYNKILRPAEDLEKEYNTGKRRDEFKSKYADKLSAFNDKLKAIEGEDFDLVEKAFSDFDALEDENKDGDKYVAALIAKVTEQLDKISKAFGNVEIEAKIEDTDKDGEPETVKVEADTDTDGVSENKETIAIAKEEEPKEEEKVEIEEETEEPEIEEPEEKAEEVAEEGKEKEDSPEEIEADLKALEEEMKKYRR